MESVIAPRLLFPFVGVAVSRDSPITRFFASFTASRSSGGTEACIRDQIEARFSKAAKSSSIK
jgi:hypothetical protein